MSNDWPGRFQPVSAPSPAPRAPTRSWLLAGLLGAALIVAAVLAFVYWTGANPTASPSPTSSPTELGPTSPMPASPTAGSSEAVETVPPDIATQIDGVIATVPAIRQLQPTRSVPYFMISRQVFVADLQADFDRETDLTVLAAQARLLERLGLLSAGTDLRQTLLDLNGGAVAAFYRPDTGSFYVIARNEPFGPLDRVFVAHEYTHALQDQHFDLQGTRITDPAEGDAALAQLAVIEGDATNTMLLWAQQNLTFNELLRVFASSLNQADQTSLANAPPILVRELNFPYLEGYTFAVSLQQQGGWPAVNQALQVPPASTEQILHPEKYLAHEQPVHVELPDVSAELGAGWSQVLQQTLGELDMQVLVAGNGQPSPTPSGLPAGSPTAAAAAGWGGDRVYMWEGPGGTWAIGWATAWDTPADADEFAGRLDQIKGQFDGPETSTRLAPEQLQVCIASDEATLQALSAALSR
jgi:hypothetical protein